MPCSQLTVLYALPSITIKYTEIELFIRGNDIKLFHKVHYMNHFSQFKEDILNINIVTLEIT